MKHMKNKSLLTAMAHILAISVVTALVLMGTAMGEISKTGIVGEWHFDGDAKDSSGNGNDGTIYGAAFVSGISGKALSLDGVNDYVDLRVTRNSPDSISVETWFKYNGNISDTYIAIVAGQSADFFIGKDHGTSNILVQDGDIGNLGIGTNAWDGNWHHIVYTHSAGNGIVYLDGTLKGSGPFIGGNGNIWIGHENENVGYFYGSIDEVRIYNRALSADEVKASYEAGQIIITSTVPGAEVLLDGVSKGSATPTLTVYGVSPGAHKVKCRLSGYSDYETSVNLPASSTESATCSLSQLGSISVTSSPSGAEVYLDGALKGPASVMLKDVISGKHVIWCKKSGFEDFTQNIEVTSGGVLSVTCTLVQAVATPVSSPTPNQTTNEKTLALATTTPTNLSQQSGTNPTSSLNLPNVPKSALLTGKVTEAGTNEPAQGVTVNVDGKSIMTSESGEYELAVDVGKHSLIANKEGYESLTRSILVPETGTMLDLSLKPASSDSSWLWIVIILLIVVIAAVIIYLLYRRKKKEKVDVKKEEKKVERTVEKKKFCMFCHAPIVSDADFCSKCGKKQDETKRFCMSCGALMPSVPELCGKCSMMPPSGDDTKNCRNCGEVIPVVAKFCSACGAGQPE